MPTRHFRMCLFLNQAVVIQTIHGVPKAKQNVALYYILYYVHVKVTVLAVLG